VNTPIPTHRSQLAQARLSCGFILAAVDAHHGLTSPRSVCPAGAVGGFFISPGAFHA